MREPWSYSRINHVNITNNTAGPLTVSHLDGRGTAATIGSGERFEGVWPDEWPEHQEGEGKSE